MANAGKLLREVRLRHGISQESLARRAGTTQSAISRIERNRVSPSIETLRELVFLLGEKMILDAAPREMDVDGKAIRERLRLSPDERVSRALAEADGARLGLTPSDGQIVDEYIAIAEEQRRLAEQSAE